MVIARRWVCTFPVVSIGLCLQLQAACFERCAGELHDRRRRAGGSGMDFHATALTSGMC